MLENLPVGIPGTGFISKGIIATVFAFGIIYYFSDNTGMQVKI
jgi:hypothetical protein